MININEMPAGREMDALVAEKVMGRNIHTYECPASPVSRKSGRCLCFPYYSTDISAAWEVVEKTSMLNDLDMTFGRPREGGLSVWRVKRNHCGDEEEDIALANTVPLVICRAALRLVLNG